MCVSRTMLLQRWIQDQLPSDVEEQKSDDLVPRRRTSSPAPVSASPPLAHGFRSRRRRPRGVAPSSVVPWVARGA
uniref:Uncharacterized protein n=1 Tax=Arundo donax TaxID=35708 RepID=A0A0A9GEX5_ARUDO